MTGHRRSVRLESYDYSQAGAYFVTICTHDRHCLFGDVIDGDVHLNSLGLIVKEEWERTRTIRPHVDLDTYIVMPNHIHGIIILVGATGSVARAWDRERATQRVAPTGPRAGSIGAILAQFKSIVAKRINLLRHTPGAPVWQRSYYEHVIRNEDELTRAREYVMNNPLQWSLDRDNPDLVVGARRAVPKTLQLPVGSRPPCP